MEKNQNETPTQALPAKEWQTPGIEEIVLSCEISSYANAELEESNQD